MIGGVRLTQRSSQKVRTRPLTDREGRGVCRSFKSTAVVPVAFGTFGVAVDRPRGAEGTSGLDQGRRRGAIRSSLEAERIDLGNEPPLSVDGESSGLVDRHRVSVQWFSGTILTGLCGAALMSGAVFAALDGETNFATVPERVEAALRGAVDRHRRSHSQCHPQDRSPAATRRGQRRAPGHPGVHHDPWQRQPRDRARAPVHSCRGQSLAFGVRALRQHSRLQCAEGPRQIRGTSGECRRRRRRRAGRGGVVLHTRPQHGPAAGKDCGSGLPRRGAHPRARCRQLGRQFGAENGGDPHHFDAGDADGLCARAPRRSLCRFRAAHRARKRHAAAQDHRAGDRRQCLQRTHHRAQEGRFCFGDPARDRRDGGRGEGDHGGVRRTRKRQQSSGRLQAARAARTRKRRRQAPASPRHHRDRFHRSRPWWHGRRWASTWPSMCAAPTA